MLAARMTLAKRQGYPILYRLFSCPFYKKIFALLTVRFQRVAKSTFSAYTDRIKSKPMMRAVQTKMHSSSSPTFA